MRMPLYSIVFIVFHIFYCRLVYLMIFAVVRVPSV